MFAMQPCGTDKVFWNEDCHFAMFAMQPCGTDKVLCCWMFDKKELE